LLQVACGGETRQIIAGIAKHYTPADLVGKTVVVVANLKPVKLRGQLSQGMVLAASSGEVLSLISVDRETESGAIVR
ncbi:MAG: methionine--tRNA ligase, partial [Kiritimatiellae bacterium]|nr:methionine--tRNA ligase [Kiritimatiellia bacterium]